MAYMEIQFQRFHSKPLKVYSNKHNKQYWNDLPCTCKIVPKRRFDFKEMSILYFTDNIRSDQKVLELNFLLRKKHQKDVNEIMQFGTPVLSTAVFTVLKLKILFS
jgi:hypothetical protein